MCVCSNDCCARRGHIHTPYLTTAGHHRQTNDNLQYTLLHVQWVPTTSRVVCVESGMTPPVGCCECTIYTTYNALYITTYGNSTQYIIWTLSKHQYTLHMYSSIQQVLVDEFETRQHLVLPTWYIHISKVVLIEENFYMVQTFTCSFCGWSNYHKNKKTAESLTAQLVLCYAGLCHINKNWKLLLKPLVAFPASHNVMLAKDGLKKPHALSYRICYFVHHLLDK